MRNIKLEGTKRTPTVDFNYEHGKLELTGRSIPENTWKFYRPYIEWTRDYSRNPFQDQTKVVLRLEYINSSSHKYLLELLQVLDEMASKGHPVRLDWFYADNDEDMLEIGEDITSFLKSLDTKLIPFKRESPIY